MSKILRASYILAFVAITFSTTIAQQQYAGFTISNNITGLPVLAYPALFYSQFHPGVEGFYSRQVNKSEKNKFYVNGNIGFYYHQFVQSLVKIYPSVNYERKLSERFNLGMGLGGGYGLSFEGKNAFTLQEDGMYKNKKFLGARSQYLIALEFTGTYSLYKERLNSPQLVVQLKSFMQGTYVKSYVPLLPLNSFNLGIRFPLGTL